MTLREHSDARRRGPSSTASPHQARWRWRLRRRRVPFVLNVKTNSCSTDSATVAPACVRSDRSASASSGSSPRAPLRAAPRRSPARPRRLPTPPCAHARAGIAAQPIANGLKRLRVHLAQRFHRRQARRIARGPPPARVPSSASSTRRGDRVIVRAQMRTQCASRRDRHGVVRVAQTRERRRHRPRASDQLERAQNDGRRIGVDRRDPSPGAPGAFDPRDVLTSSRCRRSWRGGGAASSSAASRRSTARSPAMARRAMAVSRRTASSPIRSAISVAVCVEDER